MRDGVLERLLRTDAGRLRLGWRLLAFVAVALCVTVALGMILPSHVLSGSVALLFGSCVAGWMLLASEGRKPAALGFHGTPEAGTELGLGVAVGTAAALLAVVGLWLSGGVVWGTETGTLQ